jgi:hypothetical protein
MTMTIRNLDEVRFRSFKSQAALEGRTIGELLNEAMELYLRHPHVGAKQGSLANLSPISLPAGSEHLSEEIDTIVYGVAL